MYSGTKTVEEGFQWWGPSNKQEYNREKKVFLGS